MSSDASSDAPPRQPRVLSWIQDAWWACSAPLGFFAHLADRSHGRPVPALGTAAAAWVAALAVAALAFVRATGSEGYVVILGLAAVAIGPLFVLVSVLGGLMLLGPGGMGGRAWEVVGWSWAPAGALALAVFPMVPLFPAIAAAVAVLAFPIWHLGLIGAGVAAFGVQHRVRTVLIYALVVFLVPGSVATLALLAALGAA
ncbi:MAG: hypothetical protein ABR510_01240 [Trueperaceae bacterium]